MGFLSSISDTYERRARLYPMLVVLVPAALGIVCWLPFSHSLGKIAGGSFLAISAAAMMSQIARDQGKRKESELFSLWGGKPSEIAMSYNGGLLDSRTLERVHKKINRLDPSLVFPESSAAEAKDEEGARRIYASANALLLGRTRDRDKFRLVFEENVNYGFRRNLWGMKAAGIVSSLIGLSGGASRILWELHLNRAVTGVSVLSAIVGLVVLLLWVVTVNPAWIKTVAFEYARQLLGATEVL